MVRSAVLVTLLVGAISAVPARAQAPPAPAQPDHYALTNVRIVAAPGRVIDRGTVVVRNGRIVAAGAQVSVPAAAIRLDLSGHTVYPGLIDVATSLGLPSLQQQGGGQGGGGARPPGAPDAPAPEVMPAREAADVFAPTANALAAVRNAGVTTLGLVFDGGIFPGRVSAVNTGESDARVLRAPVAQQIVLGRRRGAYPATLMGAIAFVRQSFYDTQYELRVREAWERQPTGPRPAYATELRGLEAVVTGALPVWFIAQSERDLDRINDLAREIGVRNYTVVGAQEGYRALNEVRAIPQPVIVSLDWPSASQVSGRAFELHIAPVSGRDDAAARADSAVMQQVRGNAAALARAGVSFALSSWGLDNPSMLRDRVRATIEAGLSPDDALRALTITPARLLGLEAALGTVEAGKLANLIVTQGDLFARDARIRHVFVDGVRYDVPAPSQQQQRGAQQGQREQPAAVTGDWVGELDWPTGAMEFNLNIAAQGDSLTGRLTSETANVELRGTRTGNEITLNGTFAPPGRTAIAITITGRVTGDELRGTVTPQGMSAINFTARRRTGGAADAEVVR